MKVVLLGNTNLNYSWFIKTHRQGLKLNDVEVVEIDYKSNNLLNIKQMLLKTKADYVFEHLSFHSHINPIGNILQMSKEVKDKVGTRFVHFCNDARWEDRYMGDISDVYHMAFVGTHPMVRNCQPAWKIPVYYSPYSTLTYKKMAKPVKDLAFKIPVFTGSPNAHRTGWQDNRAKFIEDLQKKMNIKIFKTQSAQDLRSRTPELSVSAIAILGLCVGYEIDGYIDVRPFQYMGTGALFIARKFKDMKMYFPDYIYFPFKGYNNDSIQAIKDHFERIKKMTEEERNKIRKTAFEFTQKTHSSKQRIKDVLYCLMNG